MMIYVNFHEFINLWKVKNDIIPTDDTISSCSGDDLAYHTMFRDNICLLFISYSDYYMLFGFIFKYIPLIIFMILIKTFRYKSQLLDNGKFSGNLLY